MKQENNQKLRSIPPPVPPNPHRLLYRRGGIHQELPIASRLPGNQEFNKIRAYFANLESSTTLIQMPSCGICAR
jgi:hypothetical protein